MKIRAQKEGEPGGIRPFEPRARRSDENLALLAGVAFKVAVERGQCAAMRGVKPGWSHRYLPKFSFLTELFDGVNIRQH